MLFCHYASTQWITFCNQSLEIRSHFCSYHRIWQEEKHCSDDPEDEDEHNDEKLKWKWKKNRQIKTSSIFCFLYQEIWEYSLRFSTFFLYLTLTTKSIQLFFFKVPQMPIKPIKAKMQPRAIIRAPSDRILVNVVSSTVFNTSVFCLYLWPRTKPCSRAPTQLQYVRERENVNNLFGGAHSLSVGYLIFIYQITF